MALRDYCFLVSGFSMEYLQHHAKGLCCIAYDVDVGVFESAKFATILLKDTGQYQNWHSVINIAFLGEVCKLWLHVNLDSLIQIQELV